MPLQSGGVVSYSVRGRDAHDAVYNKCQEMRRELRRLDLLLTRIEHQARRKTPFEAMRPDLSRMFNWYLSALESFFAITGAAFGFEKAREVTSDFTRRFASPTMSRSGYY